MSTQTGADRLIATTRNPVKKQYAIDYVAWVFGSGDEPDHPEGLSYMGAQAVRLAVAAIHRGEPL